MKTGGRKDCGLKKKPASRSMKVGLQFPIGKIGRCLKKRRYSEHVDISVPVYMAVVLKYLGAE